MAQRKRKQDSSGTLRVRIKQNKPRKNVILRLCIFAFVLYAAVMLVDMQVQLASRKQEADELAARVDEQFLANKELERRLQAGAGDEYIERVAREELDYVYPDEKVFIDISGS